MKRANTSWPGWTEIDGKPVHTCIGGSERCDSVLAGLAALPDDVRPDDFVLVHDAARPNLQQSDLDALLERGRADPVGAILGQPEDIDEARRSFNHLVDDGDQMMSVKVPEHDMMGHRLIGTDLDSGRLELAWIDK